MSVRVVVHAPIKSKDGYEFPCTVSTRGTTKPWAFGIRKATFRILHSDAWDSAIPAMVLMSAGSPIVRGGHTKGMLVFDYPLHVAAAAHLTRLAAGHGVGLDVQARFVNSASDVRTRGRIVAFSGGKDSRLLLGATQETRSGVRPVYAFDVPQIKQPTDVLCDKAYCVDWTIANRLLPAMLLAPEVVYYGASAEYCHRTTPWHIYYDFGSYEGRALLSNTLAEIGIPMRLEAPSTCLPTNLAQRILCERYPDLARHQKSTPPGQDSEKNLHIALNKMLHHVPYEADCPTPLFRKLLAKFAASELRGGLRSNARKWFSREMRAVAFRLQSRGDIPPSWLQPLPEEWDAEWIDNLHEYLCPDMDKDVAAIYRQYGDTSTEEVIC